MREHIVPHPRVCKTRIMNFYEHFAKFDFKRMLTLTMRDSHVSVARLRVELKNETDSNVFMCFAKLI